MTSGSTRVRGSGGYSLLEVLVVLAIVGVLASVALPGMQYLSHSTRVKSASNAVFMTLLRARSEAVKRNSNVTLSPVGSDWKNGWTLTDVNGTVLVSQAEIRGVSISGPGTPITYNNSGRIQGAAPQFSITHSSTGGDKTSKVERCVSASPNGAPYVKSTTC